MTPIQHMTLIEQLQELARYHNGMRAASLGENGNVTPEASYHAYLSDAALRAANALSRFDRMPPQRVVERTECRSPSLPPVNAQPIRP